MSIPSADTAAATKSKPNTKEQHLSPDGKWQSSPKVPRLMQYVPSGMYFARVRHNGKLFRVSLGTTVFTTAKLKLPDLNARDLTAAIATIKGTARSIGIDVTA